MKNAYKIITPIAFLVLLITGGYMFWPAFNTTPPEITSFEECIAAGYPTLDSYPEQCETPDGERFIRELTEDELSPQTRTVQLYYYDPEKDTDASGNIMCSAAGLVGVERVIPITQTPIQDSIRLLLAGELTMQEEQSGITTEYPLPGVELMGASLQNGTLTLSFNDPNHATSGGSCRSGILWMQIRETALQFEAVQEVRFQPEDLFQP